MMANPPLNVLIIGSGGREHALVKACLRSSLTARVLAAPGNGGIAAEAECLDLDSGNHAAVLDAVREHRIDWVIIGPEQPLAEGLADTLRAADVHVYGPGRDGARLEASKAFCKDFLDRHGIPTAAYRRFTEMDKALAYLGHCQYPQVVKASGLAAGKGVTICPDRATAEAAVRDMMEARKFGSSGEEIVIEECMEGPEISLMVLVCQDRYVCMPPCQDHKRIGEGDTGPNTGGMGAYAPVDGIDEALMRRIDETIIAPSVRGILQDGIDYRGTLFIGLMLTRTGPRVLEFNVRWGDPECQVLLPHCATDPVRLMWDVSTGDLRPAEVQMRDGASIIVVMAAEGYPSSYPTGEEIRFPDNLPEGVEIVHAGTRRGGDGTIRTAGGRVLGVVAHGETLRHAADKAYAVCGQINWDHLCFRRDIGWRQLGTSGPKVSD